METKEIKLSKALQKKMLNICRNADLKIHWDYRETVSTEQIKAILENGIESFEEEIFYYNLDWMYDQETEFLKETLLEAVKPELLTKFKELYPGEEMYWYENEMEEYILEWRENLDFDTNIDELLKRVGNINCLIPVYSNYDCCNSFDKLENQGYLKEVYRRVQKGVHLHDYMNEFYNGAYGGSLFCFAFSTSLDKLIKLKEDAKKGKSVLIPKGTQFGFFSDAQGAGSMFELETYKDFEMPLAEELEPNYDNIAIIADCEQYYTLHQVYGGIELNEQNIKIIGDQKHEL